MTNPKELLVVTTSSLDGIKINKYLKPVAAHVVAKRDILGDMATALGSFWNGDSAVYKKRINLIYSEVIDQIKVTASELGANCIVGLKVDMDEVSGKNDTLFMVTAIGTAVIIDEQPKKSISTNEKVDTVSFEKLLNYQKKNKIIEASKQPYWQINEEVWGFIIENQVEEMLSALLDKYFYLINSGQGEERNIFYKKLVIYFNNMPDINKTEFLYSSIINVKDSRLAGDLSKIVRDLQLIDYTYIGKMLDDEQFECRKRPLQLLKYDKPFYDRTDITQLEELKEKISAIFKQRGISTTKKVLLSSKEKAVWTCKCGKSNDIGSQNSDYCSGCGKDIFGFEKEEINPSQAQNIIDKKIELISHFLN